MPGRGPFLPKVIIFCKKNNGQIKPIPVSISIFWIFFAIFMRRALDIVAFFIFANLLVAAIRVDSAFDLEAFVALAVKVPVWISSEVFAILVRRTINRDASIVVAFSAADFLVLAMFTITAFDVDADVVFADLFVFAVTVTRALREFNKYRI